MWHYPISSWYLKSAIPFFKSWYWIFFLLLITLHIDYTFKYQWKEIRDIKGDNYWDRVISWKKKCVDNEIKCVYSKFVRYFLSIYNSFF